MIVQDVSLMSLRYMGLRRDEAFDICNEMIKSTSLNGGFFTINWHIRSLSPERLWQLLYLAILDELRSHQPWFATVAQTVEWFSVQAERFLRVDNFFFDPDLN